MDNEKIFAIIGKLYVDVINSQNIIDILQKKLKEKDQTIMELEAKASS